MGLSLVFKKILDFLDVINTKLPNLEFLELYFYEYNDTVKYMEEHQELVMPSNLITELEHYKTKLNSYTGRVKVSIECKLGFEITSTCPTTAIENYYEKFKTTFPNCEYKSLIIYYVSYYEFKESTRSSENLTFDFSLQFQCHTSLLMPLTYTRDSFVHKMLGLPNRRNLSIKRHAFFKYTPFGF